jgi:hypothetical protein
LKDTIVDRYLLSNFPAVNVGMTYIPFTPAHSTKENNTKQTNETHNTTTDNTACDSTSECSFPYLM